MMLMMNDCVCENPVLKTDSRRLSLTLSTVAAPAPTKKRHNPKVQRSFVTPVIRYVIIPRV